MRKYIFATAFSLTVFLALPPVALTRLEAWICIMYLYWSGRAIAWWAEGQLEQCRERRKAKERRRRTTERRRSA